MKTIKIKEEFQIPGTNIVLEKGDRIKMLEEYSWGQEAPFVELLRKAIVSNRLANVAGGAVRTTSWDENTYSSIAGGFSIRSSNDIQFEVSGSPGVANILFVISYDEKKGTTNTKITVVGQLNGKSFKYFGG